MNLRFLPEAEDEYQDAFDYYDTIGTALADQFAAKVEAGIAEIRRQPFLRSILSGKIRRRLVEVFPYGIYYTSDGDSVTIVAIMHQSRNPIRWKRRKKE